jgi:hypothetical protein
LECQNLEPDWKGRNNKEMKRYNLEILAIQGKLEKKRE